MLNVNVESSFFFFFLFKALKTAWNNYGETQKGNLVLAKKFILVFPLGIRGKQE